MASDEVFSTDISTEVLERRAQHFPKMWADLMPQIAVRSLLSNSRLLDRFLPNLAEWSEKDLVPWNAPVLLQNLKRLRPQATDIAETLLDRSHLDGCMEALRTLKPDIVPILIERARSELQEYQEKPDGDYWTSSTYLELLPHWPTAAVTAWPVILEYGNSPNYHYRAAAYEALGKIQGLHDQALPVLLKGLRDPRCIVRVAAANGLGLFSDEKQKRVAVPALIAALEDSYADVRAAALESLVKLGVDQPGVREAIQKVTLDPHPYVSLVAKEAMQR